MSDSKLIIGILKVWTDSIEFQRLLWRINLIWNIEPIDN